MSTFVPPEAVVDEHPREFCGLFGVYGLEEVAPTIYQGLFSQQHRGQEGAGIADVIICTDSTIVIGRAISPSICGCIGVVPVKKEAAEYSRIFN